MRNQAGEFFAFAFAGLIQRVAGIVQQLVHQAAAHRFQHRGRVFAAGQGLVRFFHFMPAQTFAVVAQ